MTRLSAAVLVIALTISFAIPATPQGPDSFVCAATLLDQAAGNPTQSRPKNVRKQGQPSWPSPLAVAASFWQPPHWME